MLRHSISSFHSTTQKGLANRTPCLQIPYTFVRGNSDYVHLPLATDGAGFWAEIDTVPEVDFVNGYAWAIASYSSVVLNLFTSRYDLAYTASKGRDLLMKQDCWQFPSRSPVLLVLLVLHQGCWCSKKTRKPIEEFSLSQPVFSKMK